MKRIGLVLIALLVFVFSAHAQVTLTPNVQLQIPAYQQTNWQVPLNFDLTLMDTALGGTPTLPPASLTPTISVAPNWITANTASTIITNFIGFPGQTIRLFCGAGDTFTQVSATSANVKLSTGTNWSCGSFSTLTLTNVNGVWTETGRFGSGTGSVSSVGLTTPAWLTVSGSPVTATGTLAVTANGGQAPHQVIGTCGSATTFAPCTLTAADVPSSAPASPAFVLQMANSNVSAFQASNVQQLGDGSESFGSNTHFKGPNPYVDITTFGARPCNVGTTPCAVGITANTTNGTTSVTLSSASTFVNGDGIVIYGAGAAQSMTTPTGLVVTPSIAAGPTGTGVVTNGPTGSTSYTYTIVARDKNGGMTASATPVTISNGVATLGPNSVGISTITRANDSVTYNTSSAHGLLNGCSTSAPPSCGLVRVIQTSSSTNFEGWFSVDSVPSTTSFVTSGNSLDSRNGAFTSGTGGTVFWWACNHLSWTAVTGAWEYYIWRSTNGGSTWTLAGVSRPSETIFGPDATFDDFGSVMMSGILLPAYVSTTTPPVSATNDPLSTTIVSGAGTTTLTLANSAGASVSGATILLDAAPGILAAANAAVAAGTSGGTVYIPAYPGAAAFVVNSYLTLPVVSISQAGNLSLNETIEFGGGNWFGDLAPQPSGRNANSYSASPAVVVGTANPGVYTPNGAFGSTFRNLTVSPIAGVNGVSWFNVGSFNTWRWMNFGSGSGDSDRMGIAFLTRGNPSGGVFNLTFEECSFTGGPNQVIGESATPIAWFNNVGHIYIKNIAMGARQVAFRPSTSFAITVESGRSQGPIMPIFSLMGNTGRLNGGVDISNYEVDSAPEPLIGSLYGSIGATVTITGGIPYGQAAGGTSPTNLITGYRIGGGVVGDIFVAPFSSGQNRDELPLLRVGNATDGIFNVPANVGSYSVFNPKAGIGVGPSYPIFVEEAPVAVPGCVVSAGGSISVGTHTFQVVPVWQNNGEGAPSVACTATTTPGNQTVTVTPAVWPVPGSPKGFNVREDTAIGPSANCGVFPQYTVSPAVLTGASPCGSGSSDLPNGGPSMLMQGAQGIATPILVLQGNQLTTSLPTGASVPQQMVVSGELNSAYDNFNRANGALGANWTNQFAGSGQAMAISSNQAGANLNATGGASYTAISPAPDQFAQTVVSVVTATAHGAGVGVRVASGRGYFCAESTTTLELTKYQFGAGPPTATFATTGVSGTSGDIIRIEAFGPNLTCYRNGVSTLTGSDTGFTNGNPGILVNDNTARVDNFSGGNLHPIAQLDTEQDWTQPQHFTQPVTFGPTNPVAGALSAGLYLGNFNFSPSSTSGGRTVSFPDFGASSGVTTEFQPSSVMLHSAYTNATTTFSNVSDGTRTMAWSIGANEDHKLVCDFVYQASAATAGPKIEITGPASPTQVSYDLVAYTSTTQAAGAPSDAATHGTVFGTSLSAGTAIGSTAADLTMRVTAGIVNGANAGTINLLAAAQGVGTLTIQPGASCRYQ